MASTLGKRGGRDVVAMVGACYLTLCSSKLKLSWRLFLLHSLRIVDTYYFLFGRRLGGMYLTDAEVAWGVG
jgi:hypothetical protein